MANATQISRNGSACDRRKSENGAASMSARVLLKRDPVASNAAPEINTTPNVLVVQ